MLDKLNETVAFIQDKISGAPTVGVILGSGLSSLVDCIKTDNIISYSTIPHFPQVTVEGHEGNLVFGTLGGKRVVAMQGRFHYYEGYNMADIAFPIRVMHQLGVRTLLACNAAGGLNPAFHTGDLMLINDHINFFPENPLRGKNYSQFGPRFPDMSKTYSRELLALAKRVAAAAGIAVQEGIYIGSSGPTLETPAEYRMMRILGADATGMSTVPEIITAHHAGIRCFGMSVITNESAPADPDSITTHEEVLANAEAAADKLTHIFARMIELM